MVKAIIFDVGGVVVNGREEEIYAKLAEKLGIDEIELKSMKKQHNQELLTGKLKIAEFAEEIKERFGIEKDILSTWKEVHIEATPANKELILLVGKLKKKYTVGAISNVPDLHTKVTEARCIYSHFEPKIISCDVGLAKPGKEIFELMLKKLDMDADECIYIDDREIHIEGAKKLGFKTILFKDNEQLKQELRKLNIIF
ncbi:MAG: HAD family phosphatase [archaeon]